MKTYHDAYFEHGHWWLKIRQTLVMLLGWVIFILPIFITGATYWAYRTHDLHGHYFWFYSEGFSELNFLMIFLTFAAGMILVFCLTMSYIQWQRSKGLVDKWPLFDIQQTNLERQAAEKFMATRLGSRSKREAARYYLVKKDQNLAKN